jgi:hypothetical protein
MYSNSESVLCLNFSIYLFWLIIFYDSKFFAQIAYNGSGYV